MSDPFEHIDDYINGTLRESDRIAFEDAIESDESLQFAVKEYHAIRETALSTIDDEVEAAFKEANSKSQSIKKPSFNKYLIAAGLIGTLVAVLGLMGYQNHQAYLERVEIAMADYTPPQVISTRSGEGELISDMDKAKDAFAKRDYDLCLDFLNKVAPANQDDEYHWINGHALFIKKDFEGSKMEFERIKSGSSYAKDIALMKARICRVLVASNGCL